MKAIIRSSTDLVNGGCNACPTVKTTSYTLTVKDITTPLEDLNVSSIIMAIVLKAGFRQELKLDVMEESIVFFNGTQTVELIDNYGILIYKTDAKEQQSPETFPEISVLLTKVNHILTNIFQLPAVEFIIE